MKWKKSMIVLPVFLGALTLFFLFIFSALFLQKHTVSIISHGKIMAVAKQPWIQPWHEGQMDVFVGKTKIFSLWEDFFDGPYYIYAFADGKRFLCDYDDDTARLDFIVDFTGIATTNTSSDQWPTADELRTYLARRSTNVVFDTKGFVRLPNDGELREVSGYLKSATPGQINEACFWVSCFGVRKSLLLDLATNRQTAWPVAR